MKTLKQILEEKPHYADSKIIQYQLDAVKEWLEQKQWEQRYTNFQDQGIWITLIDELLEELKK